MEGIWNIISWIIVGGIAGWIASMVAGTNREQGWVQNVIVGIVGAFLGGLIFSFFGANGAVTGPWNLTSFIVAIIGAIVLLLILKAVQGRT
jgi:uncharacterized membrane protein YeaQ/YmgE (transglycosylase-associated protein family)